MATRPSLEELLKDVPPAKLNQPCRDEHLCELALSVTRWHIIAPHLGLTDKDEEEISFLYPNELGRQTVAMLRKWKSKHGKKATYKRLASVFWKLAFTNVVEEICELLNSPDSSDSESDEGSAIEPEAVSELKVQQPQSADIGVLNSYAQYLRGRYSARLPAFLTLQWPPPPTQKVFNLAMIVKETIQRSLLDEELVRLILSGNVDDIVARKTSVKLENIFEHAKSKQRFILLEGAPGVGKSTLAWHICQKWECGELFQEFRVVIFVQLRDPTIQEAKSLADLLPAEDETMASDVVAQISVCRGQGILFVVDSWDELPVQYHRYSVFEKLICYPESLNLHLSTLLITSRPIASGKLQPLVSSRIEIVGFTKSEVKEYFDNALGGSDLVRKLEDQLAERPVIEAACYLPLNAAIVAHLFLDYQTLPSTLHGVFTSLVVSCITRHLTKLSGKGTWDDLPCIESLDKLPPEVKNDFCSICLLAYKGIMKNQVTFSSQDLQLPQQTFQAHLSTLSLIQGTESFKRSILYNFLHLQIQELLAAFHISKLPPSEQVKIFKDLFGQSRFAAVFEFYAAFTKFETEGIREIVASMVKGDRKVSLVSILRCLYEAQDLSLCGYVGSLLEGKLDLSFTLLSPVDCLSVGYFLCCTCPTTTMSENSGVADVGTFFIAEGLLHSSGLKHLELKWCGITAEGAKSIADALKVNQTLEHLDISFNTIGDTGVVHMAEALKSNNSLKKLELGACGLTEKGLTVLSASLVVNNSLQYLDITGTHVDRNTLKRFVSCLQENLHLTKLRLGPARDAPRRCFIVQEESSALNQVRRDKGLPRLHIISEFNFEPTWK